MPRFGGTAGAHNAGVQQKLSALAAGVGLSATQLAVAWVVSKGSDIVPVVGARTRVQLKELLGGMTTQVAPSVFAAAEQLVAVEGTRYAAEHMASLIVSGR